MSGSNYVPKLPNLKDVIVGFFLGIGCLGFGYNIFYLPLQTVPTAIHVLMWFSSLIGFCTCKGCYSLISHQTKGVSGEGNNHTR